LRGALGRRIFAAGENGAWLSSSAHDQNARITDVPVTLHHAFLEGNRVSQLAYRGAQQLQRKLVWFYSGWLEDDLDFFDPPMD
jgi:hypothetical protein